MGIYDWLANRVKGHTNLRRIFLGLYALLLLVLIKGGFQNSILAIVNKPIPIFVGYTIGLVLYIIVIIGLIGFWRGKL